MLSRVGRLMRRGPSARVHAARMTRPVAAPAAATITTATGSTSNWTLRYVTTSQDGGSGTGVAFILNYRVIADEGATTATTVGYLLPVVSVLLGAIFLGEQLNARVVAGMLVVLLGVALTRKQPVAAGQNVSPNETRDLVKR